MSTKLINSEVVKSGIISVKINNDKKMNALSEEIKIGMTRFAEEISENSEISVVILSGVKGNFSAGNDVTESSSFSKGKSLIEARRHNRLGLKMCNTWTNIPQITIASIEGVCIGGGLSLALSCDFRICSHDSLFWVPEVDLGITYSWGSIPKLVAMVGPSKAKLIVLACEKINAKMSLEWGLCESLGDDPFNIALKMANELAQKPKVPQQMAKESINRQFRIFNDFGLYEQDQVLLNLSSNETQNLLNKIKNKLKNKS